MDYYPRRMNRAKLLLTAGTLLLPFMPLLPYVKSGAAGEGVVAARAAAESPSVPFARQPARDS